MKKIILILILITATFLLHNFNKTTNLIKNKGIATSTSIGFILE